MMLQIIAAIVLMLLLAAIFIVWPRRANERNNQTPAQLFEERMSLLAQARESGELADEDFDSAARELKSQFLNQEQQAVKLTQPRYKMVWHLGLITTVALIVAITYSLNGHYRELSDWELAQKKLSEYGERALLGQGEVLTDHEFSLFALGLRTRLAKEGDDATAWMLLGRIWMAQGLISDSIDAFERALQLAPNRTAILISYSQALMMSGSAEELAVAGRSLARILTNDPDNVDALSLMALLAYEKGDNAEALSAWQMLLTKLIPEDPRYPLVQEKLAELQGETAEKPAEEMTKRQVIVNLTISPLLKQQYPDASLFVFARAAGGPPLPLAVQRIPLPDQNIQLILTEDMAMQPGWDLNSVEQIQIVARMSLTGTVTMGEQDKQVESDILLFEQNPINIHLTLEPQ